MILIYAVEDFFCIGKYIYIYIIDREGRYERILDSRK